MAHVLLVTPAYPPFPGGGERYVMSLAKHIAARGRRVTVVSSSATKESDFWQGCRPSAAETDARLDLQIIRCAIEPMPGGRQGLLAWRKAMVLISKLPGSQTGLLLRMAKRIPAISGMSNALAKIDAPVDLVHGFNISWENALVTGWRYAASRGLPFVVTPFAHLGSDGQDRVALNSTMEHQRHLMGSADALVVLTALEAEGLQRYGVAPRKVVVIGAGLEPLPPIVGDQPLLSSFGLTLPYVLFIGRASYDKGAIHAAQAVLSLHQQGMDLRLVLIGQSSAEFQRFLAQLPAQEKRVIRPLGIVDEAAKHALLEKSALLMLPSRTDSFGIVLLEAWIHGKPVVAARAGGIPGVVDDGLNGLLVPFGDSQALAEGARLLLEDEDLNRRMGEAGRQKVDAQYNWDHATDAMLDLYQSII